MIVYYIQGLNSIPKFYKAHSEIHKNQCVKHWLSHRNNSDRRSNEDDLIKIRQIDANEIITRGVAGVADRIELLVTLTG